MSKDGQLFSNTAPPHPDEMRTRMRNLAVVTQDGLESFELARSLLRLNIQTQTRRHTKTHRDTHMRWLARCCAYSHRRPRDSVTKSTDKSTQKKENEQRRV